MTSPKPGDTVPVYFAPNTGTIVQLTISGRYALIVDDKTKEQGIAKLSTDGKWIALNPLEIINDFPEKIANFVMDNFHS